MLVINVPTVVDPRGGFPADRRGYRVVRIINGIVRAEYLTVEDAIPYVDRLNSRRTRYVVTDTSGRVVYPKG